MKALVWAGLPAAIFFTAVPMVVVAQSARADHLAIHVADVDTSVAFYRDMFGLMPLPVPVAGPRWLDLGGGMALHLLPGRTVKLVDDRSVHLALATRDLAPIIAKLNTRRIQFSDFTGKIGAINSVRNDGVHQIFLQDLDGYWLEINDALASAKR